MNINSNIRKVFSVQYFRLPNLNTNGTDGTALSILNMLPLQFLLFLPLVFQQVFFAKLTLFVSSSQVLDLN